MAIVKMSKIKLMSITAYKDDILNAVHRAGCVELSATEELSDTFALQETEIKEDLFSVYDRVKGAAEFISDRIEKAKNKPYYPKNLDLKNQFVSYQQFVSVVDKKDQVFEVVSKAEEFERELLENKSRLIKLNNLITQITPFVNVKEKFSDFSNTQTTTVFFGTIKLEQLIVIEEFVKEQEFAQLEVLCKGQLAVIALIVFNEQASLAEQKLNEAGFVKCPFDDNITPIDKTEKTLVEIKKLTQREQEITKEVCMLANSLALIRTFSDFYKFQIEKNTASEKFRCTATTFIMEGYLPEESEKSVKEQIESECNAVFIEFSQPTADDNPPILLKNKNPVKQTEFVTDMYSPPNYREIDPNKIVFFFFMLFMGVIMADVGYGLLMIVIGLFLAARIKVDNGAKRLWNVIALSGVATIIFGLLFNSFFGFVMPYEALMPNPVPQNNDMDGLMTVLLFCLGLGVIHIATGYFLKAINLFRSKDILGGIFEGLVWVIFFVGMVFATFNFLFDYLMSDGYQMDAGIRRFFDVMCVPGIIMVVGSVILAMLTAGRKERGFGKFSKGFGAVYGIINIMSDILSYARLFGLMLSGMIIASTFNDMGLSVMTGGGITYILGGAIIFVGHVFNIAMGVLGAYIHNSRLQYIEFFGKFYAGEGNKFTPLGSQFDYIYLTK